MTTAFFVSQYLQSVTYISLSFCNFRLRRPDVNGYVLGSDIHSWSGRRYTSDLSDIFTVRNGHSFPFWAHLPPCYKAWLMTNICDNAFVLAKLYGNDSCSSVEFHGTIRSTQVPVELASFLSARRANYRTEVMSPLLHRPCSPRTTG